MSKQSKYIIVNTYGLEMPIVFNPVLQHKDVANGLRPVSAGFCYRNDHPIGSFSVYGESVSLGIKSRPEDKGILEKYLEYDC